MTPLYEYNRQVHLHVFYFHIVFCTWRDLDFYGVNYVPTSLRRWAWSFQARTWRWTRWMWCTLHSRTGNICQTPSSKQSRQKQFPSITFDFVLCRKVCANFEDGSRNSQNEHRPINNAEKCSACRFQIQRELHSLARHSSTSDTDALVLWHMWSSRRPVWFTTARIFLWIRQRQHHSKIKMSNGAKKSLEPQKKWKDQAAST